MSTTWVGPTTVGARALGPDLSRGLMLLFIALANAHYFLQGSVVFGGFPQDGSPVDSATAWLLASFVDGRAYPMFGLLFGYGVAHLVRRNQESGRRTVRRLLWRRSLVLFVVGFAHGVLLYAGDILAMYGVLLFVGAWAVFWRDRWLLIVAMLFFALTVWPSSETTPVSSEPPNGALLPDDLSVVFTERVGTVAAVAFVGPLGFAAPFLVGLWAGRWRILELVRPHRRLLTATAGAGIGIAVLGAQPAAVVAAGLRPIPDDATLALIGPMHDATGIAGGFGYAALIALIANRVTVDRGRIAAALAATGQRSMTCYLAQSIVWTVTFTPFLLDLSRTLSVTATAVLSTATWLGTVVLAEWMRRTGRRGPFEQLVRWVTYRQRSRTRRNGDAAAPREEPR